MISLFKAQFDVEACLEALKPVLRSGWVGLGPKTAELEAAVSDLICAKHVVMTNSCTAALQLALYCLGLKRGSVAITTPITFASTATACVLNGLDVKFCDVDPFTGNMDLESLEKVLNENKGSVSVIVPVHMGGYPCDMDSINDLAKKHGVQVMEDCAHALGSLYCNNFPLQYVGSGDNLCCFSTHAVKNLPTADGGFISTQDDDMALRIKRLRWLGIDKSTLDRTTVRSYSWEYEIHEIGFKAHGNDVLATLGLVGMKTFKQDWRKRKEIATRYAREITSGKAPRYEASSLSSYHFIPMFFEDRDAVIGRLINAEIQYGMHYKPLYRFTPFKGDPLPGVEKYAAEELTLPMHLGLSEEDVTKVVSVVNGGTSFA